MSNLTNIEKLIGSVFIGSNKVFSEFQNYSPEIYDYEKEQEIRRVKRKCELSKSQWESRKKFINKIETLAGRLLTQTRDSQIDKRPSAIEQLSDFFVTFDENYNLQECNKAFVNQFFDGIRPTETLNIETCCNYETVSGSLEEDTIEILGQPFKYTKAFKCVIDDKLYKVKTTPIFNNRGEFSYFVRMYTEI